VDVQAAQVDQIYLIIELMIIVLDYLCNKRVMLFVIVLRKLNVSWIYIPVIFWFLKGNQPKFFYFCNKSVKR